MAHVAPQRCGLTATSPPSVVGDARPYDTPVRAVVVGPEGEPAVAEVPEPDGPGDLVRMVACGLCGSDVEKLDASHAGAVMLPSPTPAMTTPFAPALAAEVIRSGDMLAWA